MLPKILLPTAAGLLLAAAFPRANQAWLGWAAFIPLVLFIARAKSRRVAFFGGWLTGGIVFFIALRWIPDVLVAFGGIPQAFSWAIYALTIAVLACYPGAACAFTRYLMFRRGERCLLLFPFVWGVMEFAMSISPFGGFPWLLAGYTQIRFLTVIQISDITGIYGVSFLLLCVNTSVAWLILNIMPFAQRARLQSGKCLNPNREYIIRALWPLTLAAVLLVLSLIYGYKAVERWEKSEAPFNAALFQGNILVDEPYDVMLDKIEHGYTRMADSLHPGSVDIVVLPESPTPKRFQFDNMYRRDMENLARRYQLGLVFNNIRYDQKDGADVYFNSAFFMSGDGTLTGTYDKIHLVPFGEYIPLKKFLFFAKTLTTEVSGFSEGEEFRIAPLGGYPANAVICFEAVFPDLVRRLVLPGSQVIVNLTNDGWYGISDAPYQHLEIARIRAVENRRYFLRAANTGFSAVIEPTGRISASTGLAEEAICSGQFGFIEEMTFYTRYGNVFLLLCVIISAAAGIWAIRSRAGETPTSGQ